MKIRLSKEERQKVILQVIAESDIETQEELTRKLSEKGIETTQATISRDIRELSLKKVTSAGGKQHYTVGKRMQSANASSYIQILSSGILSMEPAENLIIIKTVSGVAMGVAAALDHLAIDGLVGSIAGDDTIFLAIRTKQMVSSVMDKIRETIEG